jgi:hypothetical protein
MKKHFLLLSILCCVCTFSHAQNCLNYLLLQNNKKIEMTIYNKKGKEDGKQVWNVSNVKKSGNATTATVNSEFFDKKGKTLNKAVNEIKCIGGALQMNLKMMLGEQQVKAWGENAKVTAKGEFLEFPASIREGDQLKDGKLEMDIKTEQGLDISMQLDITNRKAISKETITSPAGTWECMKLTSDQKITSRIAGIGIPIKMEVTEWYAPGVGVIKTETKYGSTLVTSIQ